MDGINPVSDLHAIEIVLGRRHRSELAWSRHKKFVASSQYRWRSRLNAALADTEGPV